MQSDVLKALKMAERAVLCLNTVETDMVRLRAYVAALLEEAATAVLYRYPELALAYILQAERLIEGLDTTRLATSNRQILLVRRALRDAGLTLKTVWPDLPAIAGVTLDSVLERLIADARNEITLNVVREQK